MRSDQEVISRFMEPNPRSRTRSRDSEHGWWRLIGIDRKTAEWVPIGSLPASHITLDRLYEVEELLNQGQWKTYTDLLIDDPDAISGYFEFGLIHASAAQKIKALAEVLRS